MNLSSNLSLTEYLATSHRALVAEQGASWARGQPALLDHARRLARDVFEPARTELGVPLHTTSGYRCPSLNRVVGGRPTSRHVLALAIDVVPVGLNLREAFERIAAAVRAGQLPHVDEAIWEMGWIHLQAAAEGEARRLCLVTDDGRHYEAWPS